MNLVTRRSALKATAAAIAAPMFIPATALGKDGAVAPSERINVGLIGLGARCRRIAGDTLKNVPSINIAAVSDCLPSRLDTFTAAVNPDATWKRYTEFREMIEKENLDAVMIETATHQRAWIACNAMAAGMDAYIEKPMSLTIAEGREMVQCARKHNRVTQVGTQQRSMAMTNWACKLIQDGKIGTVKRVKTMNFVGPVPIPGGMPKHPMPEGSDGAKWWDVWTNQAEFHEYNANLFYNWINYLDYDGGGRSFGVTGWGAHAYDQIQNGLGTSLTGPVSITLMEDVHHFDTGMSDFHRPTDDDPAATLADEPKKISGPVGRCVMRYENGTEIDFSLRNEQGPSFGAVFEGTEGKIEINRNKVASNPKELTDSPENPGPNKGSENNPHLQNFADCVKSRETANADIEIGHRSTTICYLLNIARAVGRVGEELKWDPKTERFTNCDEGNKLLSRERRKGWELPS
ncbi:Gfo/Idh/MocA family protein [Novipirellula artificiosorum]|uniref:Glucose--fructose oxidoreductase n=1 Tax=Novipirellula artificiosorum TaxID=2528016 RepID=A0A5C6D708_9BACT|nr:Gfo/Idh/MocA family oxidoreductase [Novipirellula artificiosorum]TWU30669.1 Glucose--fructose oxidoreductase precursor [Novipirellula artificiosorum]